MERMTDPEERQYTLQELADSAGVSIRTIRYYIGEGLLPGPVGAGPQSHYTESHAIRLQAVSLLKDRYLPLREIRRQLAGLDDVEVMQLIDELGGWPVELLERAGPPQPAAASPISLQVSEAPVPYDAVEYIDNALGAPHRGRPLQRTPEPGRSPVRAHDEAWRRIEVAEGVELLVRDDIYRRKRDRIDWLIEWARKVTD